MFQGKSSLQGKTSLQEKSSKGMLLEGISLEGKTLQKTSLSQKVFTGQVESDKVIIYAPIDTVWQVLVNFEAYPSWNPFTVDVITDLEIGEEVELDVVLPRRGRRIQKEVVEVVKPPTQLAWGMTMVKPFLLKTLRTQSIESFGISTCCYHTVDEFSGLLTPLVLSIYGGSICDGFNEMAYALKKEAEARWHWESLSAKRQAVGAK